MDKDMKILNIKELPEYCTPLLEYVERSWPKVRDFFEIQLQQSMAGEEPFRTYALLLDSQIRGFYQITRDDAFVPSKRSPWISCLFIDEEARGNHLGSRLLYHARQEAAKMGYDTVYLATDHIGFYEKYGFREIGLDCFTSGRPAKIYEHTAPPSFSMQPASDPRDILTLAGMAHEIWNECFVGIISQGQIDYMVDKFQSYEAMRDQIRSQSYEYYFICLDGRPVGYTGVRPIDGKLMLSKIYLLLPYRGLGLAGKTFRFLEDLCRKRDLSAIWLTVNRHNAQAIDAYKRSGYILIREQTADIGGGYVMDDLVFEKSI